jgi:hypothetical protein
MSKEIILVGEGFYYANISTSLFPTKPLPPVTKIVPVLILFYLF